MPRKIDSMEMPPVTCIVLNWNRPADTIACLTSLSRGDYPNLSTLLVDNGSTDNSVAQIRAAHPGLQIIRNAANLGFGGGNNVGIRLALDTGCKYIWLLNNDTIVDPQTLTALVEAAEHDPLFGAIGSVLHYAHSPDQVQAWGGGRVNLWAGTGRHYHSPVPPADLDYLTAASLLIRSEVLTQVGLFDEGYFMYWEDADLGFRIRAAGWRLAVAPGARLLHKEGASTGPKGVIVDSYFTVSGIRFMRKHAPLPIAPILMLTLGRALRRFISGDWRRGWAVLTHSAIAIRSQ